MNVTSIFAFHPRLGAFDSKARAFVSAAATLGLALLAGETAHATTLFVPGSTFQVQASGSPDDYTDTVNLAAGTQSLDGGAVQLTISFVPAGGTNEWLVFSYNTTSGGPLSGYHYWSLNQVGLDAAIPLNFIAAYAEFTVGGVAQTPSYGIFPGYSVIANPVPGMTGTGVGASGFVGAIPAGPAGSLGAYMSSWGGYLSGAGLDPSKVNGWTQALEFQSQAPATPEPATWAMMLLGFAGLGFAGYRTSRKGARIAV